MTAAKAAEVEAKAETTTVVSVEFDGHTYNVDKQRLIDDYEILEGFEKGHVITPLKAFLGKEWDKFVKNEGKKPDMNRIGEFTEVVFEAVGGAPGE